MLHHAEAIVPVPARRGQLPCPQGAPVGQWALRAGTAIDCRSMTWCLRPDALRLPTVILKKENKKPGTRSEIKPVAFTKIHSPKEINHASHTETLTLPVLQLQIFTRHGRSMGAG
jgi:hypothetical protein